MLTLCYWKIQLESNNTSIMRMYLSAIGATEVCVSLIQFLPENKNCQFIYKFFYDFFLPIIPNVRCKLPCQFSRHQHTVQFIYRISPIDETKILYATPSVEVRCGMKKRRRLGFVLFDTCNLSTHMLFSFDSHIQLFHLHVQQTYTSNEETHLSAKFRSMMKYETSKLKSCCFVDCWQPLETLRIINKN